MSALPQLGQSVGSFDLRMACRALPNMDVMSLTDAYVVVSEKDVVTGQWRKLGQTERVDDSLNPDFVTPVRCAYLFETVQELRFEVFDFDSPTVSEFVGQTEFVLTDVVLADSRSRTVPLKSKDGKKTRGTITVFADDAGGRRQSLTLTFAASTAR
jgi:Ca2+-dependent lipid-binding protein